MRLTLEDILKEEKRLAREYRDTEVRLLKKKLKEEIIKGLDYDCGWNCCGLWSAIEDKLQREENERINNERKAN